eukprot:scaffold2752_cov393-Prasinococcus_capsulatus_cf.AAC.37
MLSLPLCACLARAYSSLTPAEPGGAPQSARAHTSYSQTPPSTSEKVTSLEFLLDAGMTFSAARRLLRKRQVRCLSPADARWCCHWQLVLPGQQDTPQFGKRVKPMEKLPLGASLRLPRLTAQDLQTVHKFGAPAGGRKSSDAVDGGRTGPAVERGQESELTSSSLRRLRKMTLYEDSHVLVINKPNGLAVQGGSRVHKHLDGLLMDAYSSTQDESDQPTRRPTLVHRLDKDVSGVLVIAKTREAARDLSRTLRLTSLSGPAEDVNEGAAWMKVYWALVYGRPRKLSGLIDAPVPAHSHLISEDDTLAREAGSEFSRALTHFRTPIVGDRKYSTRRSRHPSRDSTNEEKAWERSPGLHLHCVSLDVPHPCLLDTVLQVSAPLPAHMQEAFRSLDWEWRSLYDELRHGGNVSR